MKRLCGSATVALLLSGCGHLEAVPVNPQPCNPTQTRCIATPRLITPAQLAQMMMR
jgi:hypothetical protein